MPVKTVKFESTTPDRTSDEAPEWSILVDGEHHGSIEGALHDFGSGMTRSYGIAAYHVDLNGTQKTFRVAGVHARQPFGGTKGTTAVVRAALNAAKAWVRENA